jgi:hypothetical protein
LIEALAPLARRSAPMKALPPPSQLELWNSERQLIVVESSERQHVLRALAEILLVAADAVAASTREGVDETP